jgi:hypothetical protein
MEAAFVSSGDATLATLEEALEPFGLVAQMMTANGRTLVVVRNAAASIGAR